VKLLAELDIAERRKPQDGRIRVRLESRELDMRVSTVPTVFGESVVLRLLDRGGRPVGLQELGMPSDIFDGTTRLVKRPHGLLLVTGPTGCGKTTTLYAALQSRDSLAEKIVTVEDPVEYQLSGVTQVPVHRQAGVTFSSALRSILRQDPDVVMIGEMRDSETAEIAVQAAMTGHLVFSTLHTNDAIGAIPRLLDLGVRSISSLPRLKECSHNA
jgi:type II secretory ATPase GspE/PulE/Tfp pilus assembly ATPase PilB-like protein